MVPGQRSLDNALHTVFLQRQLSTRVHCFLFALPLLQSELPVELGMHEQIWTHVIQPLSDDEEKMAPTSRQCPHMKSGTIIVARSVGSISLKMKP